MSIKDIKNSMFATAVAEIITLPICCIKTNIQNSDNTTIKQTIEIIYKKQGIKGFYNASFPAVGSQIISSSSKWFMYKWLNKNVSFVKNDNMNKVFSGFFSGITSSLFTHPIDSVKIHMQMSTPFIPELKKNGIKLFYRGYSKTFAKIAVGNSLFFPLNDIFTEIIDNKSNFMYRLAPSALSAFISTIIVHPLDYIKTRQIYGLSIYLGINPINYYKGLSLNLTRVIPHFIIMINIINYLNDKN